MPLPHELPPPDDDFPATFDETTCTCEHGKYSEHTDEGCDVEGCDCPARWVFT